MIEWFVILQVWITILYLYIFAAAEAKIATMNLSYAVFYLQIAEEIVDHLEKGIDIVNNLVNDADAEGVEVICVIVRFFLFGFYLFCLKLN